MAHLLTVQPYNSTTSQQARKDKKEQVAAGVGGAAGLGTATRMASKRGLLSKTKTLQSMMDTVTTTAGNVTKNTETATSLLGRFKLNAKIFTKDILKMYESFKNSKFIGAIVKSPIVKKSASLFGGVLAFFVLTTGANKAIKTGALAVDDVKEKIHSLQSAA